MIFTNDKNENQLNIHASIKLYLITFVPHLFEHHIDLINFKCTF